MATQIYSADTNESEPRMARGMSFCGSFASRARLATASKLMDIQQITRQARLSKREHKTWRNMPNAPQKGKENLARATKDARPAKLADRVGVGRNERVNIRGLKIGGTDNDEDDQGQNLDANHCGIHNRGDPQSKAEQGWKRGRDTRGEITRR
jgi:hypothetical protein